MTIPTNIITETWQFIVSGAAGIIAIMSMVSAYNHYKLRKCAEDIRRRLS